jgi:hypothetical protein
MARYAGQHGRKVFGPGKKRSAAQLAKDIVWSMQQTPGRNLRHYGVKEESEIGQLVMALLNK